MTLSENGDRGSSPKWVLRYRSNLFVHLSKRSIVPKPLADPTGLHANLPGAVLAACSSLMILLALRRLASQLVAIQANRSAKVFDDLASAVDVFLLVVSELMTGYHLVIGEISPTGVCFGWMS
jgi:hypothetical protein